VPLPTGAAVALALSANVHAADAKMVNIAIDPATLTSQVCANPRAAGVPGWDLVFLCHRNAFFILLTLHSFTRLELRQYPSHICIGPAPRGLSISSQTSSPRHSTPSRMQTTLMYQYTPSSSL
jgi:hypothetical protein